MPCNANWRTVEAWCGNKVQKSLQRSSSNQRPRSADTVSRHRPHPCPLIVHPTAKMKAQLYFESVLCFSSLSPNYSVVCLVASSCFINPLAARAGHHYSF
jgi:hypothetical protein